MSDNLMIQVPGRSPKDRFESLSQRDKLRAIGRMVFIEDKEPSKVADILGLSQATISRYLKQARQQKIFQFVMTQDPQRADEDRLLYALSGQGLRRAYLVSRDTETTRGNIINLSHFAGEYLVRLILDPELNAGTEKKPNQHHHFLWPDRRAYASSICRYPHV